MRPPTSAEAARAALLLLANATEDEGTNAYGEAVNALEAAMQRTRADEALEDSVGMMACAAALLDVAVADAPSSLDSTHRFMEVEALCEVAASTLAAAFTAATE